MAVIKSSDEVIVTLSNIDNTESGVTISNYENRKATATARLYTDNEYGGILETNIVEAGETIIIGNFAWIAQSNGHVTFKYLGGDR